MQGSITPGIRRRHPGGWSLCRSLRYLSSKKSNVLSGHASRPSLRATGDGLRRLGGCRPGPSAGTDRQKRTGRTENRAGNQNYTNCHMSHNIRPHDALWRIFFVRSSNDKKSPSVKRIHHTIKSSSFSRQHKLTANLAFSI
jgi:hypothetical protein